MTGNEALISDVRTWIQRVRCWLPSSMRYRTKAGCKYAPQRLPPISIINLFINYSFVHSSLSSKVDAKYRSNSYINWQSNPRSSLQMDLYIRNPVDAATGALLAWSPSFRSTQLWDLTCKVIVRLFWLAVMLMLLNFYLIVPRQANHMQLPSPSVFLPSSFPLRVAKLDKSGRCMCLSSTVKVVLMATLWRSQRWQDASCGYPKINKTIFHVS